VVVNFIMNLAGKRLDLNAAAIERGYLREQGHRLSFCTIQLQLLGHKVVDESDNEDHCGGRVVRCGFCLCIIIRQTLHFFLFSGAVDWENDFRV
jgi:hypothetical protein